MPGVRGVNSKIVNSLLADISTDQRTNQRTNRPSYVNSRVHATKKAKKEKKIDLWIFGRFGNVDPICQLDFKDRSALKSLFQSFLITRELTGKLDHQKLICLKPSTFRCVHAFLYERKMNCPTYWHFSKLETLVEEN